MGVLCLCAGFCPRWSAMIWPDQYLLLTDRSSHLRNQYYSGMKTWSLESSSKLTRFTIGFTASVLFIKSAHAQFYLVHAVHAGGRGEGSLPNWEQTTSGCFIKMLLLSDFICPWWNKVSHRCGLVLRPHASQGTSPSAVAKHVVHAPQNMSNQFLVCWHDSWLLVNPLSVTDRKLSGS